MSTKKTKDVHPEKVGKRSFRSTTVDANLEKQRSMTAKDWKVLSLVMAIATVVRIYGLAWPSSVVFDEVHFGKFAKKYIIGRFFFDVHPPLAKMLYAMFAFLGGFDGESDFDFDTIGDDYMAARIPYVVMRLLPSLAGLATIALCYSTMRASGVRTCISAFTALLLTFENTFATESRYILLDSPLVFFMAVAIYGFKRFENSIPFSKHWYKYLLLTGLGIGAEISSKWVGLFTVGWIGTLTVYQLWWIWGDLNVTPFQFQKHFWNRLFFFIGVPAMFYMGMFALHFQCVDNVGNGVELLPRWFQASLKHNTLPTNVPLNVSFGSTISLRHVNTNGGWLHSHPYAYPEGSQQQQVTLYPYDDENNRWFIENGTEIVDPGQFHEIKDGDIIRLMHVKTQRRLHSHDHRAPLTPHDYVCEVTCYGFDGFDGDWNDNWRVKIIESESVAPEDQNKLQAMRTYFQLEHVLDGCKLYSKEVALPDWGFGQQEVSCIRDGKGPKTLWFIEHNFHPEIPKLAEDIPLVSYKSPSFWKRFVAIHKVMWNVNKGLTDPHHWESRPLSWVTLKRGINMWGQHNRQVYLTGNLPIYWTILLGAVVLAAYKVGRILYWQTAENVSFLPKPNTALALFDHQFSYYALGWWFHLFPSFFMDRQLFLHHYLASLYFGILMVGQFFELLVSSMKSRKLATGIVVGYLTLAVSWYVWFSPLIYGTPWTKQLCDMSKYMDMDFDCNRFLDNFGDYRAQALEIKESQFSAYHGLNPPEVTESQRVSEDADAADAGYNAPAHAQLVQEKNKPDQNYEHAPNPAAIRIVDDSNPGAVQELPEEIAQMLKPDEEGFEERLQQFFQENNGHVIHRNADIPMEGIDAPQEGADAPQEKERVDTPQEEENVDGEFNMAGDEIPADNIDEEWVYVGQEE